MPRLNKSYFISTAVASLLFSIYVTFIVVTNPIYGSHRFELFIPADNNTNTPEIKIGELSVDMPLDLLPLKVTRNGIEFMFSVNAAVNLSYNKDSLSKSRVFQVEVIGRDLSTYLFLDNNSNYIYYLPCNGKSGKTEAHEHPTDYRLGYFEIIRSVQ